MLFGISCVAVLLKRVIAVGAPSLHLCGSGDGMHRQTNHKCKRLAVRAGPSGPIILECEYQYSYSNSYVTSACLHEQGPSGPIISVMSPHVVCSLLDPDSGGGGKIKIMKIIQC